MSDSSPSRPRKQVAVIGAGIAGLTAAHELIERGYEVEVYECATPSVRDRYLRKKCAVGGVARTQWSRVNRTPSDAELNSPLRSTKPIWLLLDEPRPDRDEPRFRILFEAGTDEYVNKHDADGTIEGVCRLLSKVEDINAVEVRGHFSTRQRENFNDGLDRRRAAKVASALKEKLPRVNFVARGAGLGYPDDWSQLPGERDYVSFRIDEHWIPGEHGFRFFPSFYRNVFDTMRRTPIADENQPVFQETPRTVLDNVVPTKYMGLSTLRTREPFLFERRPAPSLQDLFNQATGTLSAMGHSLDDMNRFHLKLLKYMTSCAGRRKEYENLSWWDFLEAEQFSEPFRQYLESGAETLVAMVARKCDARTYGSVSVQMIANQLSGLERTDVTLNAPTSIAWFDHWRRYLETQGVRFHHAELVGFEVMDDQTSWPVVDLYRPAFLLGENAEEGRPPESANHEQMAESGRFDTIPTRILLVRDYYVLALGANDLQDVLRKSPRLAGEDFDRVRHFALGDPKKASTGGALEHMSGIQFYFDSDIKVVEGHSIFPDSPWRLSAIFQPQFWMQKAGWWSGYRGVLSVDISNFRQKGTGKTFIPRVWGCTREEIARHTLEQIRAGFDTSDILAPGAQGSAKSRQRASSFSPSRIQIPKPLFFHLDENLVFDEATNGLIENRTPFLLSRPGEYRQRPGNLQGGYQLQQGRYVIAGVLAQTHTRLSTMEAANESGRHAVNAILKDDNFEGEPCRIFELEAYEPADLQFAKEIDQQLFQKGLPHFMDILSWKSMPESLLSVESELSSLATDDDGPVLELASRPRR